MPNGKQLRLDRLMAEGLEVYPATMRGVPRFLSTSQATIAGMGQRPARLYGRRKSSEVVLNARQGVWGTGRSVRPPSAAARARNQQRFVQWMKKAQPRLYAIAKQRAGPPPSGLSGLGQETATDDRKWYERFTDTITNLAPAYIQYSAQKDLLNIQLERARQGLPPLETTQYTPTMQVGLDPEQTRAALAQAGGAAADFLKQPMVLAAAGGILLLVLMKK